MSASTPPVFRFAPSPNGALHLGHAYSALLNKRLCEQMKGVYLLRIEDIDQARCTVELEQRMLSDLRWLGIEWEDPPRRQSQHFADYQLALEKLHRDGLIYPAFMTRGQIRQTVAKMKDAGRNWPRDPDGSPHYPGEERHWSVDQQEAQMRTGQKFAWRLDMNMALGLVKKGLSWQEWHPQQGDRLETVFARPQLWGDVILARSDTPTSYHLSVTLDDAAQHVSHVVRGQDLYQATSIHRLLQTLLNLPPPIYHHHKLVVDEIGQKLSKSKGDVSLQALRLKGINPDKISDLFCFNS